MRNTIELLPFSPEVKNTFGNQLGKKRIYFESFAAPFAWAGRAALYERIRQMGKSYVQSYGKSIISV